MDLSLFARLILGSATSVVEWYSPFGAVSAAELADAAESLIFDSPVMGDAMRS